ncbi:MAG: PorP/SprF family type IX secretion system membrane protein [Flavobacteriales bacterium]|nr:PorP/SprF family type IX secretion system membrane protein [Flavobacteriales bacterium]
MTKNYLKKLLVPAILILASNVSKAQHDPYFTHFRFIQQAYNPAAAGEKVNYICLTGLTHYQYRGYTDQTLRVGSDGDPTADVPTNQAPETYSFNINTLLNVDKKGRHQVGVGVSFLDDQIGFMKTTTMKAAVNYRIPVQGKFGFLAVGLEAGTTSFGYDDPKFKPLDPNDPHIPISGGSQSKFDMGVGVYYLRKTFLGVLSDFYVGASYNHLNAAKYNFQVAMANGQNGVVDMDFKRYLHLNVGADYQLGNPNWKLEPALLVKYNPKFQLDASVTSLWSETIRAGLAYRTAADALSILVGYQRNELQIGYSYDITLSKIRKVSDGTHEIYVKYCIPISFPEPKPKLYRLTPRFMGRGAY